MLTPPTQHEIRKRMIFLFFKTTETFNIATLKGYQLALVYPKEQLILR